MQVSDEPGGSRSGIAYVVGDAPMLLGLLRALTYVSKRKQLASFVAARVWRPRVHILHRTRRRAACRLPCRRAGAGCRRVWLGREPDRCCLECSSQLWMSLANACAHRRACRPSLTCLAGGGGCGRQRGHEAGAASAGEALARNVINPVEA